MAHNEACRKQSVEMQRLATMARSGQADEARRLMAQIDRSPRVFDGARLEPAVRHLVALGRLSDSAPEERK